MRGVAAVRVAQAGGTERASLRFPSMNPAFPAVVIAPEPTGPTRVQTASRVVLGLLLLALGVFTLWEFAGALAWAAVFAVALWPWYARITRRFGTGRHNLLWPALFTLGVALVFVVPLGLVVSALAHETTTAVAWMRDVQQHGLPVPDFVARVPLVGRDASSWWQDNLSNPDSARRVLNRFDRGSMVGVSRQLGSQIAHRLLTFFFVMLTLFVLFRDGDAVVAQMRAASRRAFGPRGEMLGQQIISSIHGTVDGLVLVGLGQGVLIGVAYIIAGVPHPVLLGSLTGVAAMVPFAGPVVFCFAALILLVQGSTAAAIAVVAWGFVVMFTADHFIRPALIGGATKLPFLWVLLGILGGVQVFGLLGLFMGPAIMAVLMLLWRELATPAAPPMPSASTAL